MAKAYTVPGNNFNSLWGHFLHEMLNFLAQDKLEWKCLNLSDVVQDRIKNTNKLVAIDIQVLIQIKFYNMDKLLLFLR